MVSVIVSEIADKSSPSAVLRQYSPYKVRELLDGIGTVELLAPAMVVLALGGDRARDVVLGSPTDASASASGGESGVPKVKKCLGWHFELERHGSGLSESTEQI